MFKTNTNMLCYNIILPLPSFANKKRDTTKIKVGIGSIMMISHFHKSLGENWKQEKEASKLPE